MDVDEMFSATITGSDSALVLNFIEITSDLMNNHYQWRSQKFDKGGALAGVKIFWPEATPTIRIT